MIVDFVEYKTKKDEEKRQREIKLAALKKLTKPEPNPNKFNHDFYKLVDLFMKETYPDYVWRFDVWLDDLQNKSK